MYMLAPKKKTYVLHIRYIYIYIWIYGILWLNVRGSTKHKTPMVCVIQFTTLLIYYNLYIFILYYYIKINIYIQYFITHVILVG